MGQSLFGKKMPAEIDSSALEEPELSADVALETAIAEDEEKEVSTYKVPEGKTANVALAPSAKDKALPPGLCNIGRIGFHIPDKQAQMDGFYVDNAGVLVAQYPQYKFVQKKGEDNAQTISI